MREVKNCEVLCHTMIWRKIWIKLNSKQIWHKVNSKQFHGKVCAAWKVKFSSSSCCLLFLFTLLFYQIEPKSGVTLISAFLGIHRHPMQKEFLKSCEGFLGAALTGHDHLGIFWKIAKMTLFDPCMEFEIFFGPNDFIWGAIKVPFFDFNKKMSLAPSSSVQLRPSAYLRE